MSLEDPMLTRLTQDLEPILSLPDPRTKLSSYHDMPYALFRYDAEEEFELRKQVTLLETRLSQKGKHIKNGSWTDYLKIDEINNAVRVREGRLQAEERRVQADERTAQAQTEADNIMGNGEYTSETQMLKAANKLPSEIRDKAKAYIRQSYNDSEAVRLRIKRDEEDEEERVMKEASEIIKHGNGTVTGNSLKTTHRELWESLSEDQLQNLNSDAEQLRLGEAPIRTDEGDAAFDSWMDKDLTDLQDVNRNEFRKEFNKTMTTKQLDTVLRRIDVSKSSEAKLLASDAKKKTNYANARSVASAFTRDMNKTDDAELILQIKNTMDSYAEEKFQQGIVPAKSEYSKIAAQMILKGTAERPWYQPNEAGRRAEHPGEKFLVDTDKENHSNISQATGIPLKILPQVIGVVEKLGMDMTTQSLIDRYRGGLPRPSELSNPTIRRAVE